MLSIPKKKELCNPRYSFSNKQWRSSYKSLGSSYTFITNHAGFANLSTKCAISHFADTFVIYMGRKVIKLRYKIKPFGRNTSDSVASLINENFWKSKNNMIPPFRMFYIFLHILGYLHYSSYHSYQRQ